MSVNIPEELYEHARQIDEASQVAVDEAAWQHLQARAARGDRDRFLAVLDKVPDIEPEAYDSMMRRSVPVSRRLPATPI